MVYPHGTSGGKYRRWVVKDLQIRRDDSVLDIGCGSGAAMRTFLGFPFRNIDGIEIDRDLALGATVNFRRLRVERARVYGITNLDEEVLTR